MNLMDTIPVKRPKGVWIVTIWMFVSAGLIPIVGSLLLYLVPPEGENIMSESGFVASLLIGLCVIASALYAWLGYGWARFALVALAIIHYGFIAYNLYSIGQSGTLPESKIFFVWTRFARALISMTIIVLYLLLSRKAKDFFRDYRRVGVSSTVHSTP